MQNDVYNTKRNKQETTSVAKLIRTVPVNSTSSCSAPSQFNVGPWSPSVLVSRRDVLRGKFVSPSPKTQPDGPILRIHGHRDKVTQLQP